MEEYKLFVYSLSKDDKKYLLESIKYVYFKIDTIKLHPEIIENWEIIILNSNKHKLIDLEPKKIGNNLKELRELIGMYKTEVAIYLGISDKTLKNHEDGEREISLNMFYKLMKLYRVEEKNFDSFIFTIM